MHGTERGAGRRLRVLVSAVVCGPDEGSEPGAGWWWATAAASRHDVWLLALDTCKERIEKALAGRDDLALQPVYLTQPSWLPGATDDLRALRLRYLVWQRQAVNVVRALHDEIGFDVAHHVTLASDWLPAAVSSLPDVPFVWGPVGGYTRPAWKAARWLGPRWLAEEAARRTVTSVSRHLVGGRLARHAAVVVAQNPDAARILTRLRGAPVETEPNVAIAADLIAAAPRLALTASDPPWAPPRRAVFAGRLVGWKATRLLLLAMADPQLDRWALDVYGDGPERAALGNLAHRLGIADRVHLWGQQPRDVVIHALSTADVMVLPSLNDSAGWAIAEASALGCPTVCLDRGGPTLLVRDGLGTAVAVDGDVPAALAAAIAHAPPRFAPSERWSTDRLPDLVHGWYDDAVRVGAARGRTRRAGAFPRIHHRGER